MVAHSTALTLTSNTAECEGTCVSVPQVEADGLSTIRRLTQVTACYKRKVYLDYYGGAIQDIPVVKSME